MKFKFNAQEFTGSMHHTNWWLLVLICLGQVGLIALPAFMGELVPVISVLVLISVLALLHSISYAILYMCLMAAVIPFWFAFQHLLLPLNFTFYEGLLMVVLAFAGLDWLLGGRLAWRRSTRLDLPVMVFISLLFFSMLLGQFYNQSTSQMLRDVRAPLYYVLFFVTTGFFDVRKSQTFLYVVVAAAAIVGIEYLAEFFDVINLSVSGSFFRVSRLEGLLLPIGTLVVSAIFLFDTPSRQLVCGFALIPISIALVLTVGRGMWIATAVGMMCLAGLIFLDRQMREDRGSRLFMLVLVPILVFSLGYVFQNLTHTAVGSTALRRVTRVVTDYESDHSLRGRFLAYNAAVEKILVRPFLGGGHGQTITVVGLDEKGMRGVATLGGVDNVYLTVLLRMGIVGLASFLWIYIRGIRLAYGLFQRAGPPSIRLFCASFIAVYSGMLVYGMADGTLVGNQLIFFHAAFLGILARLDSEAQENA